MLQETTRTDMQVEIGPISISGEFEVNGNEVNINVDVESFNINAKLHIAVVEKEYQNMQGTNGEVEFFRY